jgi:NitT/TauT family transport system substrate-binding protein
MTAGQRPFGNSVFASGGIGNRVSTRRSHLSLLASAAVAAVGTGCSVLSGSEGDSGSGGSGGGLEKTSLRVGELPILDCAAINLAKQKGYFKNEGLDVKIVSAQGGAVVVPQLVSEDLDFGWSNWPSAFLAQSKGVSQFQVISGGFEAGTKTIAVMAKPDGPIQEPKDLEGKRVAINTFKNIVELTTRSAMQVAGVDANKVQFVELPFPDMATALDSGQVDAAAMVEPFVTSAERDNGSKVILDTCSGPTKGIPIAGIIATKKFVDENPNTTAAFRRAIDRAQRELADRRVVEQIVPTYVNVDDQTTKLMQLGVWPTTISKTRLQRVADLMLEFGALKQRLDVTPLLPKSAT